MPIDYFRELPDGTYLFTLPTQLQIFASTAGSQTNPEDHHPWGEIFANHQHVPGEFLASALSEQERLRYYEALGVNGLRADIFAVSKCTDIATDPIELPNGLSQAAIEANQRLFRNGVVIKWDQIDQGLELLLSLDRRFMQTLLTLFHWDWPAAIPAGWEDSRMAEVFIDYYQIVFEYLQQQLALYGKSLHDLIPLVILANEPMVFNGNLTITRLLNTEKGLPDFNKFKNILLNLSAAAEKCRQNLAQIDPELMFGISNNLASYDLYPAETKVVQDINQWLKKLVEWHDSEIFQAMMLMSDADREQSLLKIFFSLLTNLPRPEWPENLAVAVNYWHSRVVDVVGRRNGRTEWLSELGWHLDPAGLLQVLRRLGQEHPGKPIFITEIGSHFNDLGQNGTESGWQNDNQKAKYMIMCLISIAVAIGEGVDVRVVSPWGVIDNIEWLDGLLRSGFFGINRSTGEIYPRPSAKLMGDLFKTGSIIIPREWMEFLGYT